MRRKRIPPTCRATLNLEELQKLIAMSKVRNFADIAPNIGFSEFYLYGLYRSTFEKSELGRIRKLLTLHEMAEIFGLARKSMRMRLGVKSCARPIVRDKENGIQTSFVKRGRTFSEEKKGKDLVRQELARVRATAMEGTSGTQKEQCDRRRVKARTKLTEILYIFCGIHTANVVQLANRIEQRVHISM